MIPFAELAERGFFSTTDAFASVVERFGVPGSLDPSRVFHARVAGGFDFMVDASRGFDIGDAWVRGVPLSWCSPIRDHRPLDRPSGRDWIDRFTGGLLTTCGPENIGAASERGSMHGTFGHRPARVTRTWSGLRHGRPTVVIEAEVEFGQIFGAHLRVERQILSDVDGSGRARLQVFDRIVNDGPGEIAVPMLYHVNLGAPLVVPGTTVAFEGSQFEYREPCPAVPDPRVIPEPVMTPTEAVVVHRGMSTDSEGLAVATVRAPDGTSLEVAWSAAQLPHAYQWVLPTARRWALGIEPASAPMFGSDRSGANAGAPVLSPGESRDHLVELTLDLPGNGSS